MPKTLTVRLCLGSLCLLLFVACAAIANWSLLGERRAQWKIRRCAWRDCSLYFCAQDKANIYDKKVCQEKAKEADPARKARKKKKARDRYRFHLRELSPRRVKLLDEKRSKREEKRGRDRPSWRDTLASGESDA